MWGKRVRVVFINDKLEEGYLNLPEDILKRRINYVIEQLKENPTFGRPIAKRLIPKEYKIQGVNNAYWVSLSKTKGWRLIYSLVPGNEEEVVAIILE